MSRVQSSLSQPSLLVRLPVILNVPGLSIVIVAIRCEPASNSDSTLPPSPAIFSKYHPILSFNRAILLNFLLL